MITATIKTTKAELLFVMLPDVYFENRKIEFIDGRLFFETDEGFDSYKTPKGDWTLLGNAFQLNSEVMERVCDDRENIWYRDYTSIGVWLSKASKSYASLLRKLEIYAVNLFGEEPDPYKVDNFAIKHIEWQHAQSRTSKSWIVLASFINCKK